MASESFAIPTFISENYHNKYKNFVAKSFKRIFKFALNVSAFVQHLEENVIYQTSLTLGRLSHIAGNAGIG